MMKKLVKGILAGCFALSLIACSKQTIKFNKDEVTKMEIVQEYEPFETREVSKEDCAEILKILNQRSTFANTYSTKNGIPEGVSAILRIYGKETTEITLLLPYLVVNDQWYVMKDDRELRYFTGLYE